MPALGGLGTDTVTHTRSTSTSTPPPSSFVLGATVRMRFGSEVFVTINTYTIPFFTETWTVFTDGTGALANASQPGPLQMTPSGSLSADRTSSGSRPTPWKS